MDHEDNKIHNPVENYMREIMNLNKPGKPAETTAEPTRQLEVKGSVQPAAEVSRNEAVKVADALKQAVSFHRNQLKKAPETQIFNIRRHPIGLVYLYVLVIVGYSVVFSLISYLLPAFSDVIGVGLNTVSPIVGYLMLTMVVIGIISLVFASRSYLRNRLILTDAGLTFIDKTGRGNDETLQLPLKEIESIDSQQNGLFSRLFNYGTFDIKTLDDKTNMLFKYVPNPDFYTRAIQDAKLEYIANNDSIRL